MDVYVSVTMADLSRIPLVALSIDTKTLVSALLNPTKWIPTDDGIPRDWRGLAHLCNISGETIPSLAAKSDPTGHIITIVETKTCDYTLKDLESILRKIDRWDVLDDAAALLARDAEKYLERMERCETSAVDIGTDNDKKILTIDDLYRFGRGLDKQYYDAFLLYSDEDMGFVTEMIENLEKKENLKLCIKDRDLIGGITFEHEAVMQLISERCNRLIVVVSPNFLKSPANKFFLNYAQAVGIESQQRKIVPCLYQKCQLPPQLSYTFILDYGKVGLYDFWGRLRDSVIVVGPPSPSSSNQRYIDHCRENNATEIRDNAKHSKIASTDMTNSVAVRRDDVGCNVKTTPVASSMKSSKTFVPWRLLLRKKEKKSVDAEEETAPEPATETISLTVSLPSLDNLPSLDIPNSTSSAKPAKRNKNRVRSCVKKMQALLSK